MSNGIREARGASARTSQTEHYGFPENACIFRESEYGSPENACIFRESEAIAYFGTFKIQ